MIKITKIDHPIPALANGKQNLKIPAADPCLSPFESFLNAYEIVIARLHKYCPFIASIAASEASKLAKLMNANPLLLPVSGSLIIFGVCRITPKALNVSYKSFSSTSGSRFPMNKLAPTSKFFWCADACGKKQHYWNKNMITNNYISLNWPHYNKWHGHPTGHTQTSNMHKLKYKQKTRWPEHTEITSLMCRAWLEHIGFRGRNGMQHYMEVCILWKLWWNGERDGKLVITMIDYNELINHSNSIKLTWILIHQVPCVAAYVEPLETEKNYSLYDDKVFSKRRYVFSSIYI